MALLSVDCLVPSDKGSVLIAAWGLPPLAHENDPGSPALAFRLRFVLVCADKARTERAVRAALSMLESLFQLGSAQSAARHTKCIFFSRVVLYIQHTIVDWRNDRSDILW